MVWSEGMLILIYKHKGDPKQPENYRPITLLSCECKLFTSVLNNRRESFIKEHNILLENQASFRKDYSTLDHIVTLNSIIELLRFYKRTLLWIFIDFSKAF